MLKMKKKSSGGGANWMDTYGDMVTLLLCFFVMLYSMSTISSEKWKAIVQSFNPFAKFDQTEIIGGNDGPSSDPEPSDANPSAIPSLPPSDDDNRKETQEAINDALEKLYESLKEYLSQTQSAQQVELIKGDGYVFISFNEAVFFGGDSYKLLPAGKEVLTDIAGILDRAKDYIDEIRVMGHTAQARANSPNFVEADRLLSAERAAIATAYLQMNTELDPARIVSAGYGQWRPVAPNDVEANKSRNRRVEILISGKNVFDEIGDSLQKYESLRTAASEAGNQGGTTASEPPT